ncbi:hypothetical protein BaRGS_00011642 [Batillaria attramentaria]|uniref:Uncharacterized protein n=1 Tax=Batillaria attramentaria TaxID=370345 RepID=A0ABD0LDQ7_9CAEN
MPHPAHHPHMGVTALYRVARRMGSERVGWVSLQKPGGSNSVKAAKNKLLHGSRLSGGKVVAGGSNCVMHPDRST